ncbi:MAG: tail fiber protein [Chitinophagaceae bacterium]
MDPYVAEIRVFAGDYAPQNWLLCDGSLVSISDYSQLFSVLGTTYGGNGTSTFGLPNLCGRLPVQNGQLQGGSNYPFAQPGGQETVVLNASQTPAHTHSITVSTSPATTSHPLGNWLAAPVDDGNADDSSVLAYMPANAGDATLQTVTLAANTISPSAYTTWPHENRQPYLVINYIICTNGAYPPPPPEE